MRISKIHRNLNYVIIGFLGLLLLWVAAVTAFTFAQGGAGKPVQTPTPTPAAKKR
jgi:hypothetical protein